MAALSAMRVVGLGCVTLVKGERQKQKGGMERQSGRGGVASMYFVTGWDLGVGF